MTAIRSFNPTIWPSGASLDGGSKDLEAPGWAAAAGGGGGVLEG